MSDRVVTLDLSGLGGLLGDARTIGEELRRTAADRGLRVHIAIAATRTAVLLLARVRAGLTVTAPGEEAGALAALPLSALTGLCGMRETRGIRGNEASHASYESYVTQLQRWGLRTLGDLAAIPAADLSERLGQDGVLWQRLARGEDLQPLIPSAPKERFEESLDLEWPIEGLEPMSFVLGRLYESLCARLEQRDRGAVVLHVRLALVSRDVHERSLQLPAPMRDPRVLRMLTLLDLESHPPSAAIDRITIEVDVTEGRVLQFGLFARTLPVERLTTLLARLKALMGADRVGAPALVDSYQPGAFAMTEFGPSPDPKTKAGTGNRDSGFGIRSVPNPVRLPTPDSRLPTKCLCTAVRRFRLPIPARVTIEQGRPVRVVTDRRGVSGGRVEQAVGPWRSSGHWWAGGERGVAAPPSARERGQLVGVGPHERQGRSPASYEKDGLRGTREIRGNAVSHESHESHVSRVSLPWDCDEWDVVLSDGAAYRISHAREVDRSMWFVNGILD